jgi:hypothetical protein
MKRMGALTLVSLAAACAVALAITLTGGGTRRPATTAAPAVLPSAPGAVAAATGAARTTKTQVSKAVTNITPGYLSPALRDLPPSLPGTIIQPESAEPESYPVRAPRSPSVADPVVQRTPGTKTMPAATSFDGLQNQDNATLLGASARPPDSEGDVGPTQYVEWINLVMRVYNKSGTPLTAPAAGNSIFSNLPATSLCRTTNNGDPLVVYDQLAGRWVLSQFAFNGVNAAGAPQPPYEQCVAVSTTGDATGTYCTYDFNVSQTAFNDYGKIGVWPDGYYFSFGMFAGGAAYSGPGAMVVERPQMIQAGCPAAKSVFYQIPDPNHDEGLPSDVDGPNPPPAGRPNFYLFPNATEDGLELWKFSVVDWSPAVPVTTFLKNPTDIPVAPFDETITCAPTSRSCVPQGSTTNKLDLVGFRFMYRLAYRNWGSSPPTGIPANTESLVTNESVDAGTDHVGVRWYEIRDPNGTPTAFQQSTYAPDASHRWMGSAAMDHSGDLAIGFTASGPNGAGGIDPTPRYAGRLQSDPLSTLAQGESDLFAGPVYPVLVATNTAGDQRWGDYSHLTLDPINDCTFWDINEYQTNAVLTIDSASGIKRNWGTRIGHFRFPSCTGTTAVAITSLSARWAGKGIAVGWRTGNEAQVLGFDVFRSTNAGPFRKLNRLLVTAKQTGSTRGATYRFVDPAVKRGHAYTYRLRVVTTDGRRSWYGIGAAASR